MGRLQRDSRSEAAVAKLTLLRHRCLQALVLALPVLAIPSEFNWPILTKLVIVRAITVIMALAWAVEQVKKGRIEVRRTALDLPILTFIAGFSLATLFSIQTSTSIIGKYHRYDGLLMTVNYFLLFFLATQTIRDKRQTESLANLAIVAATISAAYGLLQFAGIDPVNPGRLLSVRSSSTFYNPVFFGGYLAMLLPLVLARSAASERRIRLFAAVASLTVFLALLFTFSRGSWLAAFAGVAVVVVVLRKEKRAVRDISLLIAVLAVVAASLLIAERYAGRLADAEGLTLAGRIASIPRLRQGSVADRLDIWRGSTKLMAERTLLGFGPDSFDLAYPRLAAMKEAKREGYFRIADNAHNYFIQLAVTGGFVSLLLLVTLLVCTVLLSFRSLAGVPGGSKAMYAGLIGSQAGYLAYLGSGINVLDVGVIFWLLAALAIRPTATRPTLVAVWARRNSLGHAWTALGAAVVITVVALYVAFRMLFADVYYGLAEKAAGDFGKAQRGYRVAMALNPYQAIYPRHLGKLYVDEALRKGDERLFRKAVGAYARAIKTSPFEVETYGLLGKIYLMGAQVFDPSMYRSAEQELQLALELYPYWASARTDLAIVYLKTGRPADAEEQLKESIDIGPDDASPYLYLGMAYEGLGDKESAVRAYAAALRLEPNLEKARDRLSQIQDSAH